MLNSDFLLILVNFIGVRQPRGCMQLRTQRATIEFVSFCLGRNHECGMFVYGQLLFCIDETSVAFTIEFRRTKWIGRTNPAAVWLNTIGEIRSVRSLYIYYIIKKLLKEAITFVEKN